MNTLVVGHWQRDTAWANDVPDGWRSEIVTHGDRGNEGREPEMFLWWMHKNYPRIRKTHLYAFVHDDALHHDADLFTHLAEATAGFRWLGDPVYEARADGIPHHPGLPVAYLYRQWTGQPFPGIALFAPGGQFVLPGRMILAHPRAYYEELRRDVREREHAWVLERLWEAVFTTERSP